MIQFNILKNQEVTLVNTLLAMLIAIPVLLIAVGQLGMLTGSLPANMGVTDGKLKTLSATRNSVSSQAKLYPDHPMNSFAAIDALPSMGDTAASMGRLLTALQTMPGVRITVQQSDYLRAEASTKILGFVDDLEFWFNPQAQVIELRSASRLGREDFGTNRKRIEAIRAAYQH
tara:strand:+ start:301 stop:819 length:519 start_codon:yes stop_codon:yes gene_type:complete